MRGKTFEHEQDLPRVPVPSLERSVELVQEWADPLLTDAERDETRLALEQLLTPGGAGQRLQQQLQEEAAQPEVASWLAEFWQDRYLGRRDRIALNANFFFLLNDTDQDQVERAAQLVTAAVDLKLALDAEQVPVATRRDAPLSMEQFKFLFSATRIPAAGRDTARTAYDSSGDGWPGAAPARHIVVLHRGRMYRLDVVRADGAPHTLAEVAAALRDLLTRASDQPGPGLGRLTTLDRESWARHRAELLRSAPNAAALELVEAALFCLCLDETIPQSSHEAGDLLLFGDPENRWYDKALSFVVFGNGAAGLNGEHCKLDGTTVVALLDTMAETVRRPAEAADVVEPAGSAPQAQEIPVELSPQLREVTTAAGADFTAFADGVATRTVRSDVGANDIKAAGASPDALAQMAIQLAHHRTKGRVGATYESVAMRAFRHGRTEAMRVVTQESVAFVEAMADAESTPDRRQAALRAALAAHVARAKQCQAGDAPEQHLWELQLLHGRSGATDTLAITDSPGWRILRDDYLSTSAVPSPNVQFFGFGATSPQCIGVGYAVHAERFEAYLSTDRRSLAQLDAFAEHLATALPELVALLGQD